MATVTYTIDKGGVEALTIDGGHSDSTPNMIKAIEDFNDALYKIDASASFTLNIDYTPMGNPGE